jgi:hypothetical protein
MVVMPFVSPVLFGQDLSDKCVFVSHAAKVKSEAAPITRACAKA